MTAARRTLEVLRNEAYLTPGRHLLEAQRLLWLADEELAKPGTPRSIGDLAALALAHALTAAVAADLQPRKRGGHD